MGYDKNAYNNQYKKDKFDHFGFYAPKGTRERAETRAKQLGMKLSEYLRYLIEKDAE